MAPLKPKQNAMNKADADLSIAFWRHASLGTGRLTGGEKIAVNLPLPFLVSENKKLVVGFLDRCLVLQNLGLPGRRSSDIGQIAHFHDLVEREPYVQFDGAKTRS